MLVTSVPPGPRPQATGDHRGPTSDLRQLAHHLKAVGNSPLFMPFRRLRSMDTFVK